MRARTIVALLFTVGEVARAAPLPDAMTKFDAGDYEAVVANLQGVFGSHAIADAVDRAQALRIYGIACVLTGRALPAEAAFIEWLGLEPRARLDPSLVRPDVVKFFEQVRARHREQLLREVERRRPRWAGFNLIPPLGQLQNGQRVKFFVLLGLELGFAATSIGSYVALTSALRPDGTLPDCPTPAMCERGDLLKYTNWISTGLLAAVVVYAVVDGFVVWRRIRNNLERDAASLRASADPMHF